MKTFIYLIVASILAGCTPGLVRHTVNTPEEVRFVTSDIERFWSAFDKALTSSDPAAVFDSEYLRGASRGLQDFLAVRIGSADQLSKAVLARRKYMESIRQNTLSLARDETLKAQIRQNFVALEKLYPEANFTDAYFLIGRFSSGGTTSASGLLLGSEFSALAPDYPLEELTPWERANVRPLSSLPFLVTHELIHTLQRQSSNSTLLEKSINEGSADFLAALVSGQTPNGPYFAYGLANEKSLWAEFSAVMYGNDASNWLYQGDRSKDRPADLGYFVGYRIVEAFYQKANDKHQAIRSILELSDAKALLEQSGYMK